MDSPSEAAVAARQHKHKDTATALEALLEIKHSPSFTPVSNVDGFGVAQDDLEKIDPKPAFRSVAPTVLNNLQMPAPPEPPSSTSRMAGITKLLAPRQGPVPSVSPTAHLQTPQPHGVLGHHHQHHQQQQLFAGGTSNRQEQHRHQAILASAAAAAHGIALGNVVATAAVTSPFPNNHPSSSFSAKPYPADGVVAAETGDPSTVGTSSAVSEANITVREDEIKAALESRPQRGKKRDNLTALERKELTKTRNREHARSTRMRKKARNDELLFFEQKYLEVKKRQDLTEARRGCINRFFAIRTGMLLSSLSTEGSRSKTPSLADVVENEWLFDVTILGVKGDSMQGTNAMRILDDDIVAHMKSRHDDDTASANIKYKLGEDGLAISGDVAIALAELVDQETKDVILSLTVQFKFATGMAKIRSLAWSSPSTPELFHTKHANGAADAAAAAAGDGLNKQIVIPSVVSMHSVASLDHTSSTESNEAILTEKVSFPCH